MKPAPILALQRFDVVNVVLYAGQLLAENGLLVELGDLLLVLICEPRGRGVEL